MAIEVLIGIDIGSTNIKCIAIEPYGGYIKLSSISTNKNMGAWPEAIVLFNRVCEAIQAVIGDLPSGTKILGVAASSVGCMALCLDHSGSQIIIDSETGHIDMPQDCMEVTGYSSNYHNAGALLANAKDKLINTAHVMSVADYIAYRLSGVFARDLSTAGSMSMYDRRTGKWWDRFKELSGLSDSVLGEAYPSGTHIGAITQEAEGQTGIPKGVPVSLGGHDYLCAAFALGCVNEGSFFNVLGTFEMAASFSRSPVRILPGVQVFSDYHCYPERFTLTCESLAGGQLEWLRNNTGNGNRQDYWEYIFRQIESLQPSFEGGGNELFLPRIFGEFFPTRNNKVHGGFIGLTSDSDEAHIIRAAIEGLCMISRNMFTFIGADRTDTITVAGGGSRQKVWIKTKADVLGCPIKVPQVPEAAASGAALLAGVGAGIYTSYEEASKVFSEAPNLEYYPSTERTKIYDQIYQEIFLPMLEITSKYDVINNTISGG